VQRIVLGIVVVLSALAVAAGPSGAAAPRGPQHLKPAQQALGRSLGDWIGAWWQHYLELPLSDNPLVGNGSRCDTVAKVLMPVYGAGSDAECTARPGTWTLLNVWTAECSMVEPPPFHGSNPAELRACVWQVLNDNLPESLSVSVDGVPVDDVWGSTGTSSALTVNLPPDNLLIGAQAATTQIVAAGWAVLLHPLPPGTHVAEVCLHGPNVGVFEGCDTVTLHVTNGQP
jgi:hypothetical protein